MTELADMTCQRRDIGGRLPQGTALLRRLAIGMALASATIADARDLPVPAGKGWQHAETGVALMPQLAGLRRTSLTDATDNETDVTAQFEAPDGGVVATLYLFRPAVADVALWFDRSRIALEARDRFRDAAPASADPVSFAVGGAPATSSLRQVYASPDGPFRSTALAVVPVGEWIATLRISAKTLTADQLDAHVKRTIDAIRWPASTGAALVAATPIKACATPLAFTKAKRVKPDGADILASLLAASIVAGRKAEPASKAEPRAQWCREGEGRVEYGTYRSADTETGYVLALYDAGRVARVSPSLMGQVNKTGGYAVSLEDVNGTTSSLPSFGSLPMPKQVWDLVNSGKRAGSAKAGQLTIDPKAF